jgi:hypothetical protein
LLDEFRAACDLQLAEAFGVKWRRLSQLVTN